MMLRRSFGTIHAGHLIDQEQDGLEGYWTGVVLALQELRGFNAGAFALERGEDTGRLHIQFYIEHDRKRPETLATQMGLTTSAVFDVVRDAAGSWAYCTGTGAHSKKSAEKRHEFGTPKLHGDTQKADLRMMVGLVMDGIQPEDLIRTYPYAWAVHRQRLMAFYRDFDRVSRGLMVDWLTDEAYEQRRKTR